VTINFIDAIRFPFEDRDWVTKIAITLVLLFIPILGWLVIGGYTVRLIRNVLTGEDRLPEYDDWVDDFVRGLVVFIAGLVYNFPAILLACCTAPIGDNGVGQVVSCFVSVIQFGYSMLIAPFFMAAVARFSLNEDFGVFFDLGGRVNDVVSRLNDAVMLWINLIALHIAMAVIVSLGFVLCCIPGLVAIAAGVLIDAHMTAQWGRVIGAGTPRMV
jgi:hypothetical protein